MTDGKETCLDCGYCDYDLLPVFLAVERPSVFVFLFLDFLYFSATDINFEEVLIGFRIGRVVI